MPPEILTTPSNLGTVTPRFAPPKTLPSAEVPYMAIVSPNKWTSGVCVIELTEVWQDKIVIALNDIAVGYGMRMRLV